MKKIIFVSVILISLFLYSSQLVSALSPSGPTRTRYFSQTPLLNYPESQNFYYPLVLRNWGGGAPGFTQWSDVILLNTTGSQKTAEIRVHGRDGQLVKTIQKTLAPHAYYGTYGDSEWNSLDSGAGFVGWVEIFAPDRGIYPLNRLRILNGSSYDSPAFQIDDDEFLNPSFKGARSPVFPLFVRNWGGGTDGYTQWTDFILTNVTSSESTVTFNIYNTDGSLFKTITEKIPPFGWFNTYGDPDWTQIPAFLGSVEMYGTSDIVGIARWRLLYGNSYNSTTVQMNDVSLFGGTSKELQYPYVVRGISGPGANQTQWSDIILLNKSGNSETVTLSLVRDSDGQTIEMKQRTLAPHAYFNTYGDSEWNDVPKGFVGWVKVTTSSQNLVLMGLHRWRLVDGGEYNSAPVQTIDNYLIDPEHVASQTYYYPLITRNWPSDGNYVQISDVILSNPQSQAAAISIEVSDAYGGSNGSLSKRITFNADPGRLFQSETNRDWYSLSDQMGDKDGIQNLSSILVSANQKVVGISRWQMTDVPFVTPTPLPPEDTCPKKGSGDADCDGDVDMIDYMYFVQASTNASVPSNVSADFNKDGKVDATDRGLVISTLKSQ